MGTSSVSILVVDDDTLTRRVLCESVQVRGYEPTAAVDGKHALELISKGSFDLVLLDMKMPGISGIEVLKTLRQQYSGDELPVIVISAMEESEGISSALKWGASDYIAKPVQSSILAARIAKLLDSKTRAKAYRDLKENLESLVDQRTEELNLSNLALHRDREQYEYLLSSSPAIAYITSADFNCRFISNNISSILGYPATALQGRNFWEAHIHPEDQKDRLLEMKLNLKLNKGGNSEYRFRHRDGSYRWIQDRYRIVSENHRVEEIVGSMLDITESKTLEIEAAYKASYDPLTGLINRSEFESRVGSISDGTDSSKHVLCFLDVDEIKIISNAHGHVGVGELLRQLGLELVTVLSKRDTVGYLGSDKFGLLLRYCSLEQSAKVLERIRGALNEYRFKWEGKSHVITASIGVVEIDRRLGDAREAINAANWACDIAKEAGGDRVQVYTANTELVQDRRQEMQWVEKVNRALEEDRFLLFYQPIVPINKNDKGKHFELLIRMKDDAGKIVPPGFFLPAVERYRLSSKIDRWVIRTTFSWLDAYSEYLDMDYHWGINLSGQSLGDKDLLQFVFDELESNQIPPEKIYFEITETAAIANLSNATNFIDALHKKGCQFALDDFGSGLSSFSYLKNLAVDYLKIDGVFVKDMATDEIDVAMVKAINDVGQAMGMQTIAEFVENAEILEKLEQIGVDYAQGYGICKPQPLHEFKAD